MGFIRDPGKSLPSLGLSPLLCEWPLSLFSWATCLHLHPSLSVQTINDPVWYHQAEGAGLSFREWTSKQSRFLAPLPWALCPTALSAARTTQFFSARIAFPLGPCLPQFSQSGPHLASSVSPPLPYSQPPLVELAPSSSITP